MGQQQIDSNNYEIKNYDKVNIETDKASGVVLSSSLAWFGYGLSIVFLVAFAITKIPLMKEFTFTIFSNPALWIMLSIVMIGLVFVMTTKAFTLKISTLIILYSVFCLYFALIMAIVFLSFAEDVAKLMWVLSIPAFTMGIMGVLGYFQIFDFSKIGRFLLFSLIGLIVMGIVLYFIQTKILMMVYCLAGYAIFTLYAGFDLWRIRQSEKFLESTGQVGDRNTIRRLGIIFGFSLLTDYINLVMFLARFIRS